MTQAMPVAEASAADLRSRIYPQSAMLKDLAKRCDDMCLTAGTQLGEAVPGLQDLSKRFAALSEMLVDEGSLQPVQSLESVARDLVSIGPAMLIERGAVETMMTELNGTLSRHIDNLVDAVRFLSAVVSNIKIEIASIDEKDKRLESFVDNLKQLASKADTTVNAFKATHHTMGELLRRTVAAQSVFVLTQGAKLEAAAREIRSSLETVSARRRAVSGVANVIGTITRQIAEQIAQCVVALQIGDSTRQRLEHAGRSFDIAVDLSSGHDTDNGFKADLIHDKPARRGDMARQVCRLGIVLAQETASEFGMTVKDVAALIEQIAAAGTSLVDKSGDLVSSPNNKSRGFLADLEAKLAVAGGLIDECGRSRRLVDDAAEQMVAAFLDLQSLAESVAAMALDMTIIGTNAVVTSYRLGSRGIPLSAIAQSLRSQAVRITDAVRLVTPAVGQVLEAAQAFNAARKGQNAVSMESLTLCIAEAVATFQGGDGAVSDVRDRLEAEVHVIGDVLRQARGALGAIDDIDVDVQCTLTVIEDAVGDDSFYGEIPEPLDALLRAQYTMSAERLIHDAFFSNASPSPSQAIRASVNNVAMFRGIGPSLRAS